MASEKKLPKIEFPCENYPIRIIGDATDTMLEFVLETTATHAPDFDRQKVLVKTSSQGRFQSVTVYITVTSEQQLVEYHRALTAHRLIKMVI